MFGGIAEVCNEILKLDETLFVGKGAHKACYLHPSNDSWCIKIPFHLPDTDITRELKYRSILDKRGTSKKMLAEYYGTVETDKGTGYIFEYIRDYNGKASLSLIDLLKDKSLLQSHLGVNAKDVMNKFHDIWMEQCIVTSDTDFVNFFVQKISKTDYTIRIIDNIGTPVFIPLAYYFDYFAKKRAEKYWKRLESRYINSYAR